MKDYPWGKGTIKWVRDATANDSDKSFTVPAGKAWDVRYISATITNSATVGNRLLAIEITNGTDRVVNTVTTATVAATLVGSAEMTFQGGITAVTTTAPGVSLTGATSNVYKAQNKCAIILPAGYVIHVYDTAAIDAAADDLVVVIHYVEYDA